MQVLKKIWTWIKKFWAVLVAVVVAVAGAAFLWSRYRRQVGQLRDELTVERATNEIQALQRVKEHVLKQAGDKTEEVQRLDAEIQRNKREIVEAHENGEGLSDEEVESEFARLGY